LALPWSKSEAVNVSIDENPPPSFDREQPNLEIFRDSGANPDQHPHRRNGKIFPIRLTVERSPERLKITKQTQSNFDVKPLYLNAIR